MHLFAFWTSTKFGIPNDMWKGALLPDNLINIPWSCIGIYSEWSTLYLFSNFWLRFFDCFWALTWCFIQFSLIVSRFFSWQWISILFFFLMHTDLHLIILNFMCLFTALQSLISKFTKTLCSRLNFLFPFYFSKFINL